MTLTERIDDIIDRRIGRNEFKGKGHLDVVKEKKKFFNNLLRSLEEYQGFREIVLGQIHAQQGEYYSMSIEDPSFEQKIEIADPEKVLSFLQKCLVECECLEKRFGREAINISVIGLAGQGKSTLLQSIANLSNSIIPAADGDDCTGAKSIICNNDAPTYAKVIFYNDMELIEQVGRYVSALQMPVTIGSTRQIPSLRMAIETFKEKHTDLIDGEKKRLSLSAAEKNHLRHLEKYVDHYEEYAPLIGTTHEEHDEAKIRDYVAQYRDDGTKTYFYLAVKEVQIYTKFNYNDAGKIVLVDTIGLGDTALGIREKMISTLKNDSDAAIMLRYPRYGRQQTLREEDIELCQLIEETIGREQLRQWLFFAVNSSAENETVAKALVENLKKDDFICALLMQVNCTRQDEVEEKLLIPMLQHLANNLETIDNQFMLKANEVFALAYQQYYELCEKVSNVLSSNFRKSLDNGGLFEDELYPSLELSQRFEELNRKYSDHHRECVEIKDEIFKTLKNLRKIRPHKEQIVARLSKGDETAHPQIVYHNLADYFRASISDQVEEINETTIINLQDGLKQQIIDVLRAENGGKLGMVPVNTDNDKPEPQEWLSAFINQQLSDFPLLKSALLDILEYRLSIEGLLEYRVNNSIEHLDPENSKFEKLTFGMDREQNAKEIEQAILRAIPQIAETLKANIQDILYIPYNSFYARIKKLRERIVYSEAGKLELRRFYRKVAPYIWHDRYSTNVSKQTALESLTKIYENLIDKKRKSLFTIVIEKQN